MPYFLGGLWNLEADLRTPYLGVDAKVAFGAGETGDRLGPAHEQNTRNMSYNLIEFTSKKKIAQIAVVTCKLRLVVNIEKL